MDKSEIIGFYLELKDEYPEAIITRDFFVENTPVTKHQLWKNFRGFSNMRDEAEASDGNMGGGKRLVYEVEDAEEIQDDENLSLGLEYTDDYIYNKSEGTYIFLLQKKVGKNIVLEEEKVRSIVKLYSNYDERPVSINGVCNKLSIPRNFLIHILKALGVTHDSIPVTDQDLAEKDTDTLVEELLQEKRFNLYQKFNREDWDQTRSDANKWRRFCDRQINPIKAAIENWSGIRSEQISSPENSSEESLILGLSDLHFGESAIGDYMFTGRDWTIDDTHQAVVNYIKKIKEFVAKRVDGFDLCHIAALGDIIHGIDGETDKGTIIEAHPKGSRQFKCALNSLIIFFDNILPLFNEVRVTSVGGNHDNFADYALMQCLKSHYRSEERVSFDVSECRWAHFTIGDSLFLIEHGYSHRYKSKVPSSHGPRENYINNLMLAKDEAKNAKNRYFIMGDRHHVETKEYNNCEFYQFSTLVGGNEYADNSNWGSRPRQNGLVVDSTGVTDFINFYL